MYLENLGYKFPLVIVNFDFEPDVINIWIGNPNCKPKPCIDITVFNEKEAMINPSCSNSPKTFERRSEGMKILLKSTLRWLIEKYPKITQIHLTDKSYFGDPEKMVLTEGMTWYQKYFGALPEPTTALILRKFVSLHTLHKNDFQKLKNDAWFDLNIRTTLLPYKTFVEHHQLSGTSWFITKETIESYDIPIPNDGTTQHGSGQRWLQTQRKKSRPVKMMKLW